MNEANPSRAFRGPSFRHGSPNGWETAQAIIIQVPQAAPSRHKSYQHCTRPKLQGLHAGDAYIQHFADAAFAAKIIGCCLARIGVLYLSESVDQAARCSESTISFDSIRFCREVLQKAQEVLPLPLEQILALEEGHGCLRSRKPVSQGAKH
jgi:hypothetical protein